jgi:murein DD-endopeptidase MepM/ murein hydrolase activator NlpD
LLKDSRHVRARLALALAVTLTVAAFAFSTVGSETTAGAAPFEPSAIPATAFKPILPAAAPDRSHGTGGEGRRALQPDGRTAVAAKAAPDETPAPTPPTGPIHQVRLGDTLWQIATWHRADLNLILRWNDVDPQRLVAGQRILVPGGRAMAARSKPATVTANRNPAPATTATTRHVWPLPIRGTITRRFSSAHPAIDIAAPAGTTVRAIAAGTVTWAGWKNNGGGFVVVIRHPDGMISTYNHNRAVAVARGDRVKAGQKIAAVGATGWATGPHLDLRVEMGGRFVNPLGLF